MARDIILIGVIVFAIAVGCFITYFAANTMTTSMLNIAVVNESDNTVAALQGLEKTTDRFDYLVFGTFIALIIALIITSWFIGGIPIFMFIYFIIIVLGVILSAALSNVWEEITLASVFGATALAFPLTSKIIPYLPYYVAVAGFVGLVVMFGKPYFQDE